LHSLQLPGGACPDLELFAYPPFPHSRLMFLRPILRISGPHLVFCRSGGSVLSLSHR
jgi:hypothetical protein